jgi:heat shock protein beta
VFIRELLSNANDALEKLRITALTDREVMSAGDANVTIEVKVEEGSGGRRGQLIVRGECWTAWGYFDRGINCSHR